jgi:hypothetical protein
VLLAGKRGWITIVGAAIAIVVVIAISFSGPSEPKYEGRRLAEWLEGTMMKPFNFEKMRARDKVMRSIGPEALPWLVNVAEPKGRFANRFYDFYARLYNSSSVARFVSAKAAFRVVELRSLSGSSAPIQAGTRNKVREAGAFCYHAAAIEDTENGCC